jgi:alkyldihydroxyacetonephosphate synthase
MKWWGWGHEGIAFSHDDKPALRPFLEDALGIDVGRPTRAPAAFDALEIAAPELPASLRAALEAALGAEHVSTDALDRVVHGRGKSLRDLVRHRRGDLGRLPDVVVRPGAEADVEAIMRAALDADAVVIPFGGGTNISGSLEAPEHETRPVISIDLGRLDQVLSIDAASRLAVVQPGVFGPPLEAQLNERGWTLGHFPDSFSHSTLGGWIATRSSGMQSDKYGDVADLTRAVRVVTPNGVLVTRPVPSTSTGPSVREMVLGSEGRLGVITEATVQVHRLPERRTILGYLLPDWPRALAAMQALAVSEATPSVTRVSDAYETRFSLATKKTPTLLDRVTSRALATYLERRRGFDRAAMCLAFVGFEGSEAHVRAQRRLVGRIVARHGGLCVGASPGALYDQKKFDTPYIRDYLLDRGAPADVSETAAPWSALPGLYATVMGATRGAFAELGVQGYVMCHLSHSYHAGACLYFTFAFRPSPGADALA